jgi:aspartyl protease family protein
MTGDDNASLIYGLGAIALVGSALIARRLPVRQYAKMILAWLAIFALAFAVLSFRPEMEMAWTRVKGELTGAPRQTVIGGELRLVRKDDGHFWLRASLNGHDTDLMVDSGATTTAINGDTANAAEIELNPENRSVELDTANGMVRARTGTVANVKIGGVKMKALDVVVSDAFGDTNVVGMNFLNEFSSWKVVGDVMTLKP